MEVRFLEKYEIFTDLNIQIFVRLSLKGASDGRKEISRLVPVKEFIVLESDRVIALTNCYFLTGDYDLVCNRSLYTLIDVSTGYSLMNKYQLETNIDSAWKLLFRVIKLAGHKTLEESIADSVGKDALNNTEVFRELLK